jgi:UDP-GlcNAc:undecaprenyl-phosphate GlcNAc-1-phosphate transferase
MGDSGSQSVGFCIAAGAVGAANGGGPAFALFVPIAMTPFLADVAFTLFHRAVRRQSVVTAHREHAYQLLLRMGWRHAHSTAAFAALTLISSAAAVASLAVSPGVQWAIASVNAAFHLTLAAGVYALARKRGLFPPSSGFQNRRSTEVSANSASAAE